MALLTKLMDRVLFGVRSADDSVAEAIQSTESSLHTVAPSERAATLVRILILDITTTRQKVEFPSGAKWVHIHYRLLPGATAVANQYLKLLLNAVSDADATGKLAVSGAHDVVFQNEDLPPFTFSEDNLCRRLDLVSAQAVGAEKTALRIIAGVM